MFTLISYFFKLFHKFHYNKLVEFELFLPTRYADMNLKGFCIYHEADFEIRTKAKLTETLWQSMSDSQLKID
jgi:hypothetical protein